MDALLTHALYLSLPPSHFLSVPPSFTQGYIDTDTDTDAHGPHLFRL